MRIYGPLLILALALLGYALGARQALLTEAQRAEAVLTLADDRLTGLIERYRYLPAVLSRSAEVRLALSGEPATLSATLQRVADTSGAVAIGLSDMEGRILAYSRAAEAPQLLGSVLPARASLTRARLGALGFERGVEPLHGRRQFFFDHPVAGPSGEVQGVLSIELDMEAIEADWRGDRDAIYFTDANGVIFISNRDELVLRGQSAPLPSPQVRRILGISIWQGIGVPGLPSEALHMTRANPRIAMQAHILSDLSPVYRAGQAGALIGALLGGVGALILALLAQRRGAVEARLAERANAAQRLELQVAERTAALQATNARLAAEVEERTQAEAELRRVQDDLVQAGKMAALGEMSAGISHELNQPLTAIQTLADNSEIFMDQGKDGPVRRNLGRISQLAARAGRILKTLRAFARKEGEPAGDVDLRGVVAEALAISEARLAAEDVRVTWQPPAAPVVVRGGRVRLQQVLVNLLSNAADAMAGQPGPRGVTIALEADAAETVLVVQDTGPGLEDPDRIFDPFHTTKPPGAGLGLGLSISYGIVQQFGGQISGANAPCGGAIFRVRLARAGQREAA